MPTLDLVTVGSLFVELTPTTPGTPLRAAHHYTLVAGGAAANVVFALARLGVNVGFITAVGDDEFGSLLIDELAAFGVSKQFVRRTGGQLTPVTFCAVDGVGGKQFSFYRFPGCCTPMTALAEADFQCVTDCRIFDFCEGSIREEELRAQVFQAARKAHTAGVTIIYAVNLRKGSWHLPDKEIVKIEREAVSLANIVILNEEEVAFLAGEPGIAGMRALQRLGPRVVVMTRGGEGNMIVCADGQAVEIPPFRVPVVYDVGAGDTFHAGLVAAVLRHDPTAMTIAQWADAVRFAAATAAIRVSTSADPHDLPTFAQVSAWMTKNGADA